MPQLQEYVNRENIQPTDRGTEARVMEGRRVGAFFNQQAESLRDFANRTGTQIAGAVRDAGDAAVQYQQHREISQGVGTYAVVQDNLINDWNDTIKGNPDKGIPAADPNDPSVRQKFIEEKLTPALQRWGDTFQTEGGQKWAQGRTAALLDHMYTKTAADVATLAGQALETNVRTLGNTMSNTAYKDPSSIDHLLESVDASIGTMVDTSNVKGAEAGRAKTALAERIKEGLVKAAAQGRIRTAPDPEVEAQKWATDPRYSKYITGAEAQTLAQNARHEIRARESDDRAAAWYEKQEAARKSNEAVGEYIGKIYNTNPKIAGDPLAQQILHDTNLTKADRGHLMQLRERELKPETEKAISEQTTVDLLRRLRDKNADFTKLMDDAWAARLKGPGEKGGLTKSDFNDVRNEIQGRKDGQGEPLTRDRDHFFKQFARTIDPAMDTFGGHSQAGAQAMYLAEMDARRQEQALGPKAYEIYDPRSPNFFGRPENLEKYRRSGSLQENMKALAAERKGEVQYVKPPPFEPLASRSATFNERFGFDPAATVNVRPPAEREAGKTYDTPRGKMKWTGTGWVQP